MAWIQTQVAIPLAFGYSWIYCPMIIPQSGDAKKDDERTELIKV